MASSPAKDTPQVNPPPDTNPHKTEYKLEKTRACRQYGCPPPDFCGDEPSEDSQVFINKIPDDIKEDELIPLFEKYGTIYGLKLMMNRETDRCRGFAFLWYIKPEDAVAAVAGLNNYEVRPGRNLLVKMSEVNKKLYFGNIHRDRDKGEIEEKIKELFENVTEVYIQQNIKEHALNKGFAFVEFKDNRSACEAKRQCLGDRKFLFGRPIKNVDWAIVKEEYNEEDLSKVRALHVTPLDETVTEESLKEVFGKFGEVEKVKRVREFAFIHFVKREDALATMKEQDKISINGVPVTIVMANPRGGVKKSRKKRHYPGGFKGAPSAISRPHTKASGEKRPGYQVPDMDYYGDPVYDGSHGSDIYHGYHGYQGYDASYKATVAGGNPWKRHKPNPVVPAEKWADPSMASQVEGKSGNWW